MGSAARRKSTSDAEVTNVSKHGFWILTGDRERFVSFEDFPWFREAKIAQILNVERPSAQHLHWPYLDVDLALESIDQPAAFPLVSREPAGRSERTSRTRPRRARSDGRRG